MQPGRERDFLVEEFRKYYEKVDVDYPEYIERREFGVGFETKIDMRHKRFNTREELRQYLITNVPFFISYSVALYTAPEARPMENKNIVGSDLVFDIDVHGCKKHADKFICEECLGLAKENTIRLIEDFLIPDFGIGKKDIHINFSGNRGYHVHIKDGRYMNLGKLERMALVRYLNGVGLDAGIFCEKRATTRSPAWFGRIAKCIKKRLENGFIKTSKKEQYILDIENGNWDNIKDSAWFYREFEECREMCKADVDEQVTTDLSRLIRLPGSIHGESTLIAKTVEDIEKFNPLDDAVFISDEEIDVYVKDAPHVIMKGKVYDEINNKKERLPKYYAAYLIAKGAAKLV
ncbi:MAG: DNA primase catalytic subunit PriS [Candidatus Micrarchaeia archaeon]